LDQSRPDQEDKLLADSVIRNEKKRVRGRKAKPNQGGNSLFKGEKKLIKNNAKDECSR